MTGWRFEMGQEMAEAEGITVGTLIVDDDVAVKDSTYTVGRRGVAGNFFVIKAVGAASEQGADLDELLRIGSKVNAVTRTMGMALTSCTPPAKGSPLFELGDDEMEMGVGIHGEPGRRREKLASANEIVDELLEAVVTDLPYGSGDNVALMINGLGGTPISELYLLYGVRARAARQARHQRRAQLRRRVLHVPRHGRLLDHPGSPRRTVTTMPSTSEVLSPRPAMRAVSRWRWRCRASSVRSTECGRRRRTGRAAPPDQHVQQADGDGPAGHDGRQHERRRVQLTQLASAAMNSATASLPLLGAGRPAISLGTVRTASSARRRPRPWSPRSSCADRARQQVDRAVVVHPRPAAPCAEDQRAERQQHGEAEVAEQPGRRGRAGGWGRANRQREARSGLAVGPRAKGHACG